MKHQVASLLLALLACASLRSCIAKNTYMLMGAETVGDILENLASFGTISYTQLSAIREFVDMPDRRIDRDSHQPVEGPLADPELVTYLEQEMDEGRLEPETARYVANVLNMFDVESMSGPAPADYDTQTQGMVRFRKRIQTMDIPRGSNLFNGIWGYSAGSREYALQTNWAGLVIIDITRPLFAFEVQVIPMQGGGIWRDVATYTDGRKTYAYVAGQRGDADLYIIDLSYLPRIFPRGIFFGRGPIPSRGIKQVSGYLNNGHTINADSGFLFINTASFGTGVKILDLKTDPWNPTFIAQWREGDGHDSSFREGVEVPSLGSRDLLFSCDGYTTRHRIVDLTGIRERYSESGAVVQLTLFSDVIGATPPLDGSYAHSNALSDDGSTMYVFDEFNLIDVGIYNISDPRNPEFVKSFQWSGEVVEGNTRVHNGQVRGNYLFVAYYSAGLRVYDITDPINPVEVGNLETYRDPNSDGTFPRPIVSSFSGAWNVYLGLKSERILISDTASGTFVVDLSD